MFDISSVFEDLFDFVLGYFSGIFEMLLNGLSILLNSLAIF